MANSKTHVPWDERGKDGNGASLNDEAREYIQRSIARVQERGAVAILAVARGETVFAATSQGISLASSIFMTASVSKTVTAVIAVCCAEEGLVDLDVDINTYLKQARTDEVQHQLQHHEEKGEGGAVEGGRGIDTASSVNDDGTDDAAEAQWDGLVHNPFFPDRIITLRSLLTHHASLVDNESALRSDKYKTEGSDCPCGLGEYVRDHLCDKDFPHNWSCQAAPGEAGYHYSNAGLSLVGYVLEQVSQESLSVLAKRYVFGPLRMHHSSFFLSDAVAQVARDRDASEVHADDGEVAEEVTDPVKTHVVEPGRQCGGHYGVAEYPAAQLRSSAHDLMTYLHAMGSSERAVGQAGVFKHAQSWHDMFPDTFSHGLAWWGRDAQYGEPDCDVWCHGGMMPGVLTKVVLFPAPVDVQIVVLTNGFAYQAVLTKVIEGLMQMGALPNENARGRWA